MHRLFVCLNFSDHNIFVRLKTSENFKLAETIPGPSTEAISEVAKKNKVSVVVPLFEKRSSGVYHNSLVVIDSDGKIVGTYRKDAHS